MASIADLAVGQKIRLSDTRTGTIRFVGHTAFAQGDWVGIELDDGSGKNDGSVQGERYFDCPMGFGMFVRPTTVTVLAQPPPPKPAPAKKATRPSTVFGAASSRVPNPADAALARRRSLNAPSPTPAARPSRPSSTVRSPTRSPTKQLSTAPSSAAPSRTTTPANAKPALGARPRPSVASARPSMAPPPMPAPNKARQASISSATKAAGVPARTLSGRLSTAPRPGAVRPASARHGSSGSQSGPAAPRAIGKRGSGSSVSSGKNSDDDIIAPQPTHPVQQRTLALENLTGSGTTPTIKPGGTPTTTLRPAVSPAASNKEIEDLKTKIRVLEKKRIEDREKLNALDKIKGERDKFERIIQTLQIKYQPQQQEIAELKRQLKEAETRFYNVEEMQAEHDSAMELATLDREMAEEMAEVYKAELDALKQKAEELELELEVLREENTEITNGMSSEDRASAGWLQMEKNNERLREALIRLRDITQEQEGEFKDQIKSLEEDLAEFETVKEQFTACKEDLAQKETAIEDLREQLNNALGAEDLIESLTEQNMNQSEEIKELRAVIDDLEALKEINDELEINHIQNEKEMQQEIDGRDAVISEQIRQAAQQRESMEDMEYTLSRFRELVTSLQSDLADMRASHAVTENESEQLNSRSRAMMDLNMKLQISAAKAQVKTIDLELRRMEAQEAEQHLEIVTLFLPDSYQTDKDSVLALLRFKRLAFKANLLNGFIKERVNGQPHPGNEDDLFEGCGAIDKLTWVSCMCDRFVNAISHCSLEQFAKYEGALYELEPVERALNGWIDGLRRDELKEKQCSAELQRTIALMTHLGEVHISSDLQSFADDIHMRALLMQSHLESAAVAFATAKAMVQRVVPAAEDDDELSQYFANKTESVVSQTRSAKVIAGKTVRSLEDLNTRSLSLLPETLEAFEQCETATAELADMARQIGLGLHQFLHEEGRAEPYTYAEIQSCIQATTLTISNSTSPDTDLFSTYLSNLRTVTTQISDLAALAADLSQTQEFDLAPAPWTLRATQLKELKKVPLEAEAEVRRLRDDLVAARRAVAMREEDLSTAQVKIETLESRMRDAKAKAARIEELEGLVEGGKREVERLVDSVAKQDRELKVLEGERDRWKAVAASGGGGGGGRVGAGGVGDENGGGGVKAQERAVATAREMDELRGEIEGLQAAVRYLREDNRRARLVEPPRYDWLAEPLTAAKKVRSSGGGAGAGAGAEQRRALAGAEGLAALKELVNLSGAAKIYDLASGGLPEDRLAWKPARSTPQWHAARQAEDFAAWKGWSESVLKKSRGAMPRSVAAGAGGGDAAARERRHAVARLQIRLPGGEGKLVPGLGREVQIAGSREWEALQGRYLFM